MIKYISQQHTLPAGQEGLLDQGLRNRSLRDPDRRMAVQERCI
jgi:hypothetical protein